MEGDDRTFRANFSSEGVSRLQEDIKEKLKEFMGNYTDDTLVEYVIVLLKNGRRKVEAKSELDVFLGDDSDSFVSWLWDHLGSNLSLYVQQQEVHPDPSPKTKPTSGSNARKTESLQIECETEKQTSIGTSGHQHNQERKARDRARKTESHQFESETAEKEASTKPSEDQHNRERKRLVRVGDENEAPLAQNSVAENVNSQDEPQRRDGRTNPSLSLRPKIHKKRRRTEELQPRKREVSQPAVSAPRRLLQFAVRDAVATSRPSNSTQPSNKRLRSVVSTPTGDSSVEERPQRIRRTFMSAAIKAVAEAVKDVSKLRPPRTVFDRLGHATVVSNTTYHHEYGDVAEEEGGGDFSVETENNHSDFYAQNESSRLQERNMSSIHETIMDSDLGYDEEGYDIIDPREREFTDVDQSGASVGNWLESSSTFQYGAADDVNERHHRPYKDLGQPTTVHNTSLRIASSVSSMNIRKPPQYQEEREASEMNNRRITSGSDTVATKPDVWLMKEKNKPTVAFNGNAKADTTLQQSEKTQTPTGVHNAGPPTEDADSRTIFVSNVHFAATKDSLSRHFNKFGEVLKVIILTDPATGLPKGSAYIEFMRKEAVELALSLDGTSFMTRIVKIVRKSSSQPEAPSSMTWPRIARPSPSPFPVPRFGRVPFPRGVPNVYRARVPIKPGARSFQWKRDAGTSATETSNSIVPPPTRSLTYVRTELKTNGSSGTA